MITSQQGIDLIKSFESCRLTAYNDGANIWTIGWGATTYQDGKKVRPGDIVTQDQADDLFLWHLKSKEAVVNKLLTGLRQFEYDAYTSFVYNTGGYYRGKAGIFHPYNIISFKVFGRSNQFIYTNWLNTAVTAGGVKMNGLVKRRLSEAEMFLNGKLILHT